MGLLPGARIGPYEIDSLIGQGGMGEVYLARDTSLHRDVAIKILREEFAGDPGRLQRFQREAELLAAVNHPNIATIHGVYQGDTGAALVMELVPGETLTERIARGAMPVSEACAIAQQIAQALAAAHARGIIHRDLKPANIKITPDNLVKVLDFGLAKVSESFSAEHAISDLQTVSTGVTQEGRVLGTVPYMSPEQISGQHVDNRTDIWAFGCVLFEMSTGRRAFSGGTASETIEAVLRSEPNWSLLPTSASRAFRAILERCLHKDVHERAGDMGSIRAELDALGHPHAHPRRFGKMAGLVASGGVLLLVVGLALYFQFGRPSDLPQTAPTRIGDVSLPPETVVAERRAHEATREGPTTEQLIGASRDELIVVLEQRARRILTWLDAMEEVAKAQPPEAQPGIPHVLNPAAGKRAELLARVKQEFIDLHGRHIVALRSGQLVAANEYATEIIYLLSIVHDVRDASIGNIRTRVLAPSVGNGAIDARVLGTPPGLSYAEIERDIADGMRIHEVIEVYPALQAPPRIDRAVFDQILKRLKLTP